MNDKIRTDRLIKKCLKTKLFLLIIVNTFLWASDANEDMDLFSKQSPSKQNLINQSLINQNLITQTKQVKTGISLNFQNISLRSLLQIIAEHQELNIIMTDNVQGNISIYLNNVTWQQALTTILQLKGLGKRLSGNILLIAPAHELEAQEAKKLALAEKNQTLAPLKSHHIQINYAKATNIAALIKTEKNSLLSPRGSVSVDERTNILLIRDTTQSIKEIEKTVTMLDTPVRQVNIESRMVTVKDNVSDELGIRWGVSAVNANRAIAGKLNHALIDANNELPSLGDRLNVNLPASNPSGSIAMQVARLADGTMLDLELSAMEQENKGEIIASPRITTADQKEAYIEQGIEIPYQESALSGATTVQFKKAVLSLTVTPHITPDEKIILDLVVTQDTVSYVANSNVPAIDTQRISTQVLVKNGETIVLGGIYQQQIINSISKVPLLGDLPYMGSLFRNKKSFNEKKELLIFVTPSIIAQTY